MPPSRAILVGLTCLVGAGAALAQVPAEPDAGVQGPPAETPPPAPPAAPAAAATPVTAPPTGVAPPAPPAGPLMTVTLSSGDVLRGVLESAPDADPVVLAHPLFGRMTVARAMIKSVEAVPVGPQPPPAPSLEAAAPAPAPAPPPPPPPPPAAAAVPPPGGLPEAIPEIGFFDKWTGTVESGFNLASGSADRMNLRFAMSLRRETPETITTSNAAYNYGNDNHGVSENRARLDVRNDWLQQKDSGWRYFAAFSGEYDTYQQWDWRLTGSLGLGYDLVKEPDFTLIARAGLGASRELGRVDNTIRPEFTPGFDLEYKLDDRSKIIGSFDGYRDLDQFDIYRFVARAAYEVLIDQKNNLVLRLGVEDRYDDSVGFPRENNDVEIFTTLVFKF